MPMVIDGRNADGESDKYYEMSWDNALLQPVVITYNRAQRLERMLRSFVQAGYTSMHFHVLDNCSTDNTSEIVMRYKSEHWPLLEYHRNKYNIGGDANILRAVEVTDSEYFCAFGDDDEWNLEHFDEVLTVLQDNKADIVRLGWAASDENLGTLTPARTLAFSERKFFISLWSLSNLIVRRTLMTNGLFDAYKGIECHGPHLIPIWRAIQERELLVYTARRQFTYIIPCEQHDEANYWMGDLGWEAAWIRQGKFFRCSELRARHVSNVFEWNSSNFAGQFLGLMFRVLALKGNGLSQRQYLLELLLNAVGKRSLIIPLLILDLLVPKALLTMVVSWRRRLGGHMPSYYRAVDELEADRTART